ncbi:hypothetical protein MBLNU459_g1999t2 [Dothideomycetes sp. NU459]
MGSFGKTESIFNMQDQRMHARRRKLVAPPYQFSNIRKMEPLVDARIRHWQAAVEQRFSNSGECFDFAPWAVYMAYDVISEVGFGAPFGFVSAGEDVGGLIKGFHDGLVPFGLMARLYPFTNWVKGTWVGEKYLVANADQDSGIGTLMRFRDGLVEKRLKDIEDGTTGGRVDLLQTFLDTRDENNQPLPPECLSAEILLVLLAGADTTGTAFQALLSHMLSHPSAYDRLVAELDSATRAGQLSEMPQYEQVAAHLPYYVACLRESMRLTPSAPNMFPRVVGAGGMRLYGRHVPEGTEVSSNPWVVQRDPAIYGDDAEEFRPERWLEGEETVRVFQKCQLGFGYGARACLGKDIALMELYKAPVQFFRNFRIELDRERSGKYVYKGGIAYFEEMWMRIEKRAPVV